MTATVEPRFDGLLGGRIKLRREPGVYPPSIDAVLLAASVRATTDLSVLDVGVGCGAASFALLARQPDCQITGIDTQAVALALARESAAANGFGDRITLVEADIVDAGRALPARQFDIVMTNPPFYAPHRVRRSPDPTRSAAHEQSMPLPFWLGHCLKRVRSHGWFHLIHRADRLDQILTVLRGGLGDLRIFPIYAKAGADPAIRLIVAGRRNSSAPPKLFRGLVLHEPDGRYTEAAEAVLRHAQPLPLID